jgi:hypothetical protein
VAESVTVSIVVDTKGCRTRRFGQQRNGHVLTMGPRFRLRQHPRRSSLISVLTCLRPAQLSWPVSRHLHRYRNAASNLQRFGCLELLVWTADGRNVHDYDVACHNSQHESGDCAAGNRDNCASGYYRTRLALGSALRSVPADWRDGVAGIRFAQA